MFPTSLRVHRAGGAKMSLMRGGNQDKTFAGRSRRADEDNKIESSAGRSRRAAEELASSSKIRGNRVNPSPNNHSVALQYCLLVDCAKLSAYVTGGVKNYGIFMGFGLCYRFLYLVL